METPQIDWSAETLLGVRIPTYLRGTTAPYSAETLEPQPVVELADIRRIRSASATYKAHDAKHVGLLRRLLYTVA